ncbi:MAG: dienelactone hydrolase family protein [Microbacterium sp.]|uniref:dienelactone hydrolase family protein n=1 Tax=Microbacterium sp. TaxID=51671 RepID=UPI00271828BB|nr:dienelactone hydrolase family protein [Microbacterium sp.]MDO8382016.1 dienelactone hydrolase family protein [Microbacterium sp.]
MRKFDEQKWGISVSAVTVTGASGVDFDATIYPDARHAFFNDTGAAYEPVAAADAWTKTLDFFATNLGRKDAPA